MSHIKRHVLANVGLLIAGLYSGDQEIVQVDSDRSDSMRYELLSSRILIAQVSMVTQVTPNTDGVLIRSVYNPLD